MMFGAIVFGAVIGVAVGLPVSIALVYAIRRWL